MSNNNYYANGAVAVMSSRLLTVDKFNKLIECGNLWEATKVLSEFGYGDATSDNSCDYELALQSALNSAVSTFVSLSTDRYVTRYYMARYDYHNAKTLAKCKYNRINGLCYCYEFGSIPPATLVELIESDEYESLPTAMAHALSTIDNMHSEGCDNPRLIDLVIDRAMFADMHTCAYSARYSKLRQIYVVEIDTTNIIMLFRARGLHLTVSQYADMIIEGGSIDKQWFVDNYETEGELILDRLYGNSYLSLATICINSSVADGERYATTMRRALLVGSDVETMAPILDYYNKKTIEIDKIRYIMMCIKSGLDKDTTKDRLKELYA